MAAVSKYNVAVNSRRSFLTSLAGVAAAPLTAAPDRPNVLLIISDQFHHSVLGAAGHPVIKTPNLDRLATGGVRFENAVCATPFCSPSRASIMTGLYPHRHGITYNVGNPDGGLDPKLASTDQALFENGYACAQRGKWHLGDKNRLAPYAGDEDPEYKEARRRSTVIMRDVVRRALEKFERERGVAIGRTDTPAEKSAESFITGTALAQLANIKDKPFFLTVSLPAPHAPWIVADPYYSMYERSRIPLPENRGYVAEVDKDSAAWELGRLLGDEGFREYLGCYYGMVSMVDWNIGRLLDALRHYGVEDNTLVIFISDHGDMQGGHNMYGKSNLLLYEETSRIPMIMRLPGRIPAGRVVRTQSGHCDVRPTILDYLGLKPPAEAHGRSLRAFIDGREELDRPMFCERERGRENFQREIRTLEWKYVYSSGGHSQLHDLQKDPGETKNRIDDPRAATVRKRLHALLARWMRETGDRRAAQMPAA